MAAAILQFKSISKSFPGVALRERLLRYVGAAVHTLMGENGAGQSHAHECAEWRDHRLYERDATPDEPRR